MVLIVVTSTVASTLAQVGEARSGRAESRVPISENASTTETLRLSVERRAKSITATAVYYLHCDGTDVYARYEALSAPYDGDSWRADTEWKPDVRRTGFSTKYYYAVEPARLSTLIRDASSLQRCRTRTTNPSLIPRPPPIRGRYQIPATSPFDSVSGVYNFLRASATISSSQVASTSRDEI